MILAMNNHPVHCGSWVVLVCPLVFYVLPLKFQNFSLGTEILIAPVVLKKTTGVCFLGFKRGAKKSNL